MPNITKEIVKTLDSTAFADYIQAERILRIETPLGPDVFLPERMEMVERISGLFELSIALRSKKVDLKPIERIRLEKNKNIRLLNLLNCF